MFTLCGSVVDENRDMEEIIVGGEFAEKLKLEDAGIGEGNVPVRVWNITEDLPKIKTGLPARYMQAVGAAMAYTSKKRGISFRRQQHSFAAKNQGKCACAAHYFCLCFYSPHRCQLYVYGK